MEIRNHGNRLNVEKENKLKSKRACSVTRSCNCRIVSLRNTEQAIRDWKEQSPVGPSLSGHSASGLLVPYVSTFPVFRSELPSVYRLCCWSLLSGIRRWEVTWSVRYLNFTMFWKLAFMPCRYPCLAGSVHAACCTEATWSVPAPGVPELPPLWGSHAGGCSKDVHSWNIVSSLSLTSSVFIIKMWFTLLSHMHVSRGGMVVSAGPW